MRGAIKLQPGVGLGEMREGKEPRLGKKEWISLSAASFKGTFQFFVVFY